MALYAACCLTHDCGIGRLPSLLSNRIVVVPQRKTCTTTMNRSRIFLSAIALAVAACAPSSHILIGTPRPATSPADVKVYTAPPPQAQQIALLDAHSDSVFGPGGQKGVDKVIERLKTQAAQLGANGIVLGDLSDRQTGSIGTGVGSSSYSGNSAVGVGVGGSLGIYKKSGKATAIYVPPNDSNGGG